MKRSEMLVHIQRAYGIRHVMVETGHLTLADFMDEMLTYMEQKGMAPPGAPSSAFKGPLWKWGSGCNMHCVCEECDPSYILYRWEDET